MKRTKKPATPSRGMLPKVRAAIAAGRTDEQVLALRRPGIPITPGVVAYARRTTKKAPPAKPAAVAEKRSAPKSGKQAVAP